MNKKILTLILIAFLSVIIGTSYGVIHNFITSLISTEFYTKFIFFKFVVLDDYSRQFSGNWTFPLTWIGFFSTGWFGLLTGLVLGVIALECKSVKIMLVKTLKSILIIIGIAIISGFVGYIFAELNPSEIITNYNYPFEIENKIAFNKVKTIHNFSYLGGIVGLIIGVLNQIKKWW